MEGLNFWDLVPEEIRAKTMARPDPARWLLEAKVRTYNETPGAEDGSGIDCPVCRNKSFVAYIPEGEDRLVTRYCDCRSRRITALRLKQCGMLDRARSCTLERFRTDNPVQKRLKQLTEQWLREGNGCWLLICGQSGAGKTHLCTAAFVRMVADRGLEGAYMLWRPELRQLQSGLYREQAEQRLEQFKRAPLLYIDDLFKCGGGEPIPDRELRLAFEVLDHRYSNSLVTILSMERSFQSLMDLDQAIAGRIRERCGPYMLNITPGQGKNYRLKED